LQELEVGGDVIAPDLEGSADVIELAPGSPGLEPGILMQFVGFGLAQLFFGRPVPVGIQPAVALGGGAEELDEGFLGKVLRFKVRIKFTRVVF
jgi:hypothetical protein